MILPLPSASSPVASCPKELRDLQLSLSLVSLIWSAMLGRIPTYIAIHVCVYIYMHISVNKLYILRSRTPSHTRFWRPD